MTSARKLTAEELEELDALAQINDVLKGPSFIMRNHWHSLYQPLVRRGFVKWGPPPKGFNPRKFAGTTITDAGRAALSRAGKE